MNKPISILVSLLVLQGAAFCRSSSRLLLNRPVPTTNVSIMVSDGKQSRTQAETAEKPIWNGTGGGLSIRWTTLDLAIQSEAGVEKIWAPLANTGFEDFVALQREEGANQSAVRCDYERAFTVLSIVGTLLSFEDRYYDYCGGAHPSLDTRFTTVDLKRPGPVRYAKADDTPLMDVDLARPGRIVQLTDYFSEADILHAIMADPVVAKALAALTAPRPKSLAELTGLFAENEYELGDSQFELRPDFLTRFVFHHIEGDKVAVHIGLPPHYGANRGLHLQIALLLPIPSNLRQELTLADTRQQGFLMKHAREVAGDQTTKFRFHIGQRIRDRRQ